MRLARDLAVDTIGLLIVWAIPIAMLFLVSPR